MLLLGGLPYAPCYQRIKLSLWFLFNLDFWKYPLYKERKVLRNLLYASLTFCKILILFQLTLPNFCLKLSIDYFQILRLKIYCSEWSEISVFTIKVLISNKRSIAEAVCLMTRVGLFMIGIILNQNIGLKLWIILFLSKSRRFMLKLPISITSILVASFLHKMLFHIFLKHCCITIRWPAIQT